MNKEEKHQVVLRVLGALPSHRETPKTAEEISEFVVEDNSMHSEIINGVTIATLAFLDIFGVLEWKGNTCRLSHQIPDYFRCSLLWYFENHKQVLSNWAREGVAREINITNLLDTASYFVKLMEQKRLEISDKENIDSGASRIQPVSIILIKGEMEKKPYFLHQWDDRAEQFQLIGGRKREDELPLETAKRELQEEISQHNLVYDKDYKLILLQQSNTSISYKDVSRTYGAITAYEFWLYGVKLNLEELRLSPNDRWISQEEMKNGFTSTGKKIRDPQLYRLFDAHIVNGIESVPQSINICKTVDYMKFFECFEIEPEIPYIGKFKVTQFLHWLKSRKNRS